MDPVRKAVWTAVCRWATGLSGTTGGLAGGITIALPHDLSGVVPWWVLVGLGVLASLGQLGLSILDKIPERAPA